MLLPEKRTTVTEKSVGLTYTRNLYNKITIFLIGARFIWQYDISFIMVPYELHCPVVPRDRFLRHIVERTVDARRIFLWIRISSSKQGVCYCMQFGPALVIAHPDTACL